MQLVKNILCKIWGLIKKFPFTCYGVFSMLNFNIFSYDFFIIGLASSMPFMWLKFYIEKTFFPAYFNIYSKIDTPLFNLIAESIITLIITIMIDIFLRKKFIPLIKRIGKK
jgi:hypothetical protein